MKLRSRQFPNSLADIFEKDDYLGLLADIEPVKITSSKQKDDVVVKFEEINAFYQKFGREPQKIKPTTNEAQYERSLAIRLEACRSRGELREKIQSYDTFKLLKNDSSNESHNDSSNESHSANQEENTTTVNQEEIAVHTSKKIFSLGDIFDNDDLGLLDDIDTSIFNLEHVKNPVEKEMPDEIASRKPCEDFYRFVRFFDELQLLVKNKSVPLLQFSSKSDTATVGQAFVLRGQICYVESILDMEAGNKRHNPRLRVIFDNGTETDLLTRSLASAMYKDPHSKRIDYSPNLFLHTTTQISPKSDPTGFIYILGSESNVPAITELKKTGRLVKIGYSTLQVEERIKNAETEKTYLEAPVRLLAKIDCYNLNPQKFENLIHAFLYQQRVNITLTAHDGIKYKPEEWFAVDAETAVKVCEKIIDGTITMYRMDNVSGEMVEKE